MEQGLAIFYGHSLTKNYQRIQSRNRGSGDKEYSRFKYWVRHTYGKLEGGDYTEEKRRKV